jgi:WD40 repeat protein
MAKLGEVAQDWGVTSLHWSPDGKHLATGDGKGVVRVWKMPSLAPALTIPSQTAGTVHKIEWAPDGRLAIGCLDATFVCEPGQDKPRRLESEHGWCPTWSPDGKTLAAARADGAIDYWSTANWHMTARPPEGVGFVGGDSWSVDRTMLALSTGRKYEPSQLRLFDLCGGRTLRQLPWPNLDPWFSLSMDGQSLVSINEGVVRTLDLRTTLEALPLNVKPPPSGTVPARAPNSSLVAVVHDDHVVRLWDASRGVLRRVLSGAPQVEIGYPLAWSPDGKLLAVSHVRGEISLWNDEGGRVGTLTHADPFDHAFSILWSPDGRVLVSGGEASGRAQVRVWDVKTGRQVAKIDSNSRLDDWSPDSKYLLLGDASGLFIFAAQGGALERTIELLRIDFEDVGGSRARWLRENLLALLTTDGVVRLYDPSTGHPTGALLTSLLPSGAAAIDVDGNVALDGIDEQHSADHLVYVAQTVKGTQETLTPDEFARRFDWHNQPGHVQLLSPSGGTAVKPVKARAAQNPGR